MAHSADDLGTGPQSNWEQGSLLPADSKVSPLQWVHREVPATRIARGAVRRSQQNGSTTNPLAVEGPEKQGDRMIVITQSCDLLKPAEELPQVEVARVFETASTRIIAQADDYGSARFFRVNDRANPVAQVLDHGQRALLDKGFLQALSPDNSILDHWGQADRKLLARWLGQRYSRPAISDRDYEEITRPIRDAWLELIEADPELAAQLNSAFAELRYRREQDETLTLFILARDEAPEESLTLELIAFLTDALAGTFGTRVRVPTDRRSYHSFTKADELTSEQINMEWASHDESAENAALPLE